MKLSIITINFNNSAGIKKTIESVVNQTYKDFEYIVIDGGSDDGSKELIEKYTDKITYWVSEKDKGIYNAMNKGILKAKGEYCLFLNSGDWFCNNEVINQFIKINPQEEIVYGNLIKVYSNSKIIIDKGPQRSLITLSDMFFGTINHSSSFIKKKLFDKYGLYDEGYKVVSDWAFFLKTIAMNNVSVKYLDLDIVYFDMTGISNVNKKLRDEERSIELKKTLPESLYIDYMQMIAYKDKARIYDAIKNQSILWQMVKIYNKLFGRPLW